ncbi:hypothetical protein HGRIS_001507 [Hohenbuehelia grisea]|uniref:Uncharacterized protein n=1 Tax=Hohenbuehelia grisea TaxID=104357 RepID=A0ABR3JQI8_9AGAR
MDLQTDVVLTAFQSRPQDPFSVELRSLRPCPDQFLKVRPAALTASATSLSLCDPSHSGTSSPHARGPACSLPGHSLTPALSPLAYVPPLAIGLGTAPPPFLTPIHFHPAPYSSFVTPARPPPRASRLWPEADRLCAASLVRQSSRASPIFYRCGRTCAPSNFAQCLFTSRFPSIFPSATRHQHPYTQHPRKPSSKSPRPPSRSPVPASAHSLRNADER